MPAERRACASSGVISPETRMMNSGTYLQRRRFRENRRPTRSSARLDGAGVKFLCECGASLGPQSPPPVSEQDVGVAPLPLDPLRRIEREESKLSLTSAKSELLVGSGTRSDSECSTSHLGSVEPPGASKRIARLGRRIWASEHGYCERPRCKDEELEAVMKFLAARHGPPERAP